MATFTSVFSLKPIPTSTKLSSHLILARSFSICHHKSQPNYPHTAPPARHPTPRTLPHHHDKQHAEAPTPSIGAYHPLPKTATITMERPNKLHPCTVTTADTSHLHPTACASPILHPTWHSTKRFLQIFKSTTKRPVFHPKSSIQS